MPCFHPLQGYRSKRLNATGKRSIVFNKHDGYVDLPVTLPCGQCDGCKMERARVWAVRCVHESQLYRENSFITLTYADEHLPKWGSLDKTHYQLFMKRLRDKYSPKTIRFFQCGEYGDQNNRPHYHSCLFNHDFNDKYPWKKINGQQYYISPELMQLWRFGHSTIGDVTFQSAAYVARYVLKKQSPKKNPHYYDSINEETGEIFPLEPEYTTMSLRPGIGKPWYEKYKTDAYPHDFIVVNGKKMKPPKYYLTQLEKEHEIQAKLIKINNQKIQQKNKENNTPQRLKVREKVLKIKLKLLKRGFENDL